MIPSRHHLYVFVVQPEPRRKPGSGRCPSQKWKPWPRSGNSGAPRASGAGPAGKLGNQLQHTSGMEFMEYVYVFFIFFYGSSRTFLGSGTGVWFIIISRVKYLLRQCFGCIGYFILYYIYVCNGNQQKSSGLMGGKYATECHRSNANFIAMEAWKQEYSAYSTEKKHQKSMLYTRKDVIPSWCYNGVIMVLYLKMVVYHKSMYIIMMLYIRKYVIYQGIPSLHNHRYFASNTRKVIRWYPPCRCHPGSRTLQDEMFKILRSGKRKKKAPGAGRFLVLSGGRSHRRFIEDIGTYRNRQNDRDKLYIYIDIV